MLFAPPPRRLGSGRLAVPIDITRISAVITFDAAARRVAGEAAIEFRHGIENGLPVFDLRQPLTGAWLDGVVVDTQCVAFHQFGIRREEAMRVVSQDLQADTEHQLRFTYEISVPPLLASTMGGYLPELRWDGTGGVHFNFGFTDLGGGRYLEAWVPANLIYDRFALDLELRILHSASAHSVITNGAVSEIGRNVWHIRFPDTFTAFSPMLELHPGNSVEYAESRITEPSVRVEAWKFRSNPISLVEQIDAIERCLKRNHRRIGPYPHGDRFTAFLHQGGMEYDGACTAAPDAVEHEVFHSWWARGLKPASQNDGWIDEAWTVYHDNGAAGSAPFDFREAPVCLSSKSPWNRATPIESYRLGARFFEGIAARTGVPRLHEMMNDFYAAHSPGFVSTTQLEAHFLERTNDDVIRRAFERWVHGLDSGDVAGLQREKS